MPLARSIPGLLLDPVDADLYDLRFDIDKRGYLIFCRVVDWKRTRTPLHVLIALRKYGRAGERDQSIVVDFKDRNRLNCRRDNIRLISGHANAYNNARTDHCGVTWNDHRKKWRTRITMDGRTVYLGNYELEADAWKAVDEFKASKEYRDWYEHLFRDLGLEHGPARSLEPA